MIRHVTNISPILVGMIMKDKMQPPSPKDLGFDIIESYNLDHTRDEGFADLKALRNVDGDGYKMFCANFLQCMVRDGEWKQKSTRLPISGWVGYGLEAFAVIAYINGYENWMQTFGKNLVSDADEVSSITSEGMSATGSMENKRAKDFRFTADAKGSTRYGGWSGEGVNYYNIMLRLIKFQRARPGCRFDRDVMDILVNEKRGGRGTSKKSNAAPRAENMLDDFMSEFGMTMNSVGV